MIALTGLPNRALILDRIEQMQRRARRTGEDGAVLFIDLDRFKDVNDSLGHRVGDDVLRQVATRFRRTLRESDSIGRLGGDEFLVLIEGPGLRNAGAAARRLLESLATPLVVHSDIRPMLTISASIGIVSGTYASAEDLLMDADIALYEAKAAGRNRGCASNLTCAVSSAPGSSSNETCTSLLKVASSSLSTNRSCGCTTAPCRAWRPSCAGADRQDGSWRPIPLSRRSRRPVSSWKSEPSCSKKPVFRPAAGATWGCRQPCP